MPVGRGLLQPEQSLGFIYAEAHASVGQHLAQLKLRFGDPLTRREREIIACLVRPAFLDLEGELELCLRVAGLRPVLEGFFAASDEKQAGGKAD